MGFTEQVLLVNSLPHSACLPFRLLILTGFP